MVHTNYAKKNNPFAAVFAAHDKNKNVKKPGGTLYFRLAFILFFMYLARVPKPYAGSYEGFKGAITGAAVSAVVCASPAGEPAVSPGPAGASADGAVVAGAVVSTPGPPLTVP